MEFDFDEATITFGDGDEENYRDIERHDDGWIEATPLDGDQREFLSPGMVKVVRPK